MKRWTKKTLWDRYQLRFSDLVTVCASCRQASCWLGEFYCDNYKTAKTAEVQVRDLVRRGGEHPQYWAEARVVPHV
jgi:hypothetical protein